MNEIIEKEKVEDLIYEIRGKQVMLDSDLARLYECVNGTKTINQAVSRHSDRFPEDFYFQVSKEEYENLWSQLGTANLNTMSRTLPYVFTEQGVAMLASILRTKVAAEVSINIMRAFVLMKKYISNNLLEQKYINNLVLEDHNKIKLLQESFDKLSEKRKASEIYFNGQMFDAYSRIINIFNEAKEELIIVDSYADIKLLDIIKKLDVKVIIITKKNNFITEKEIEIYNKQYNNLKVIYNNTFHDRYFIIDNKTVYHCGTSINRIGYKTFSINLLSDKDVTIPLINNINSIK
jgi:hypothetical protein